MVTVQPSESELFLAVLTTMTPDDAEAISRVVVEKAKQGDIDAAGAFLGLATRIALQDDHSPITVPPSVAAQLESAEDAEGVASIAAEVVADAKGGDIQAAQFIFDVFATPPAVWYSNPSQARN